MPEEITQNKKVLEREVRELSDYIVEKKRLSGIEGIENELKSKKEKLNNLAKA